MATEIELKLTLSPKAASALPGHPLLAGKVPSKRRLLNTYYDTPDLLLKKRRTALRFRKIGRQWLLTVKSAEPASGGLAQRSEWEYEATPGVFDFSQVDAPELQETLEAAIPSLTPIFTTNFQRTAWILEYDQSCIEVAFDKGRISSQGRHTSICELELELVRGEISDLFALTRELQAEFHLHPSVASKAERGYGLFGNTPLTPFKAPPTVLSANSTPTKAFKSIALSCLEHLQRNEAGIIQSKDSEFIHQARVALRRLRSAIKLFAPALPGDFVTAYNEAWRTLAGSLGTARNWDVFVDQVLPPIIAAFPHSPDIRRLGSEGCRRASRAHTAVTAMLVLPEYSRLLLEFTAALIALPDGPDEIDLVDFAVRRLKSHSRRAYRLAARHHELTGTERHELRICFKKLRYALEFFQPILNERRLKPYLAVLAQLQEELGHINDHVTAANLITEVLGDRPPGPVHGWISGRHALLLDELPSSLDVWMSRKAPWKNL